MDDIFSFTKEQDEELVSAINKQISIFLEDSNSSVASLGSDMVDVGSMNKKKNSSLSGLKRAQLRARVKMLLSFIKSWFVASRFSDASNAQN
jgi:hypothetical protein